MGTTDERRHAASRSSKPCEVRSSEAPGLGSGLGVRVRVRVGVRVRVRVRVRLRG